MISNELLGFWIMEVTDLQSVSIMDADRVVVVAIDAFVENGRGDVKRGN